MSRRPDADHELWAQEVAFWDALKRADLTGCLSFFHDDVVTWPNGRATPVTKDGIFQMLVAVLPGIRPGSIAVELKRRSVRAFAEMGIVCCDVRVQLTPSGGAEPVTEKCIHVWARTSDGWKLVGGMTAPLGEREP
jgi:ketosteroid isomerase-like protein